MPRSAGVYSLPAGNPVVTGTTITSTWANTTLADIASALTDSLPRDGSAAMTGNLPMGTFKVAGLGNASALGDALAFGQTGAYLQGLSSDTNTVNISGGAATNALSATNLSTAAAATQVVQCIHLATSGDNYLIRFGAGGSAINVGVDYNRAGNAIRYNTTSDARLKNGISDAEECGSFVDSLKVRSYTWKDGGAYVSHGFIAQELVEVAPEAVSIGDDGESPEHQWGIDVSFLVPYLVKEIQSLRARVAALES